MNLDEQLDKLPSPTQGSNRGYAPDQLIKQFMTSIWCGANKFEYCEVTRHDEVLRQCWGFKQMAGCKSFQPRLCSRAIRLDLMAVLPHQF